MSVEVSSRLHGRFAQWSLPRMPSGTRRARRRHAAGNIGFPLLQCLKIVLMAAAVLIALCVGSDAQQSLSAAEIEERIVGHSFRGRKGILSVSLHYATDGTVTMRSPLGTGTGRWTLSGDRLCVKLETGPRKVDECLTFASRPNGVYRASNGLQLTAVE